MEINKVDSFKISIENIQHIESLEYKIDLRPIFYPLSSMPTFQKYVNKKKIEKFEGFIARVFQHEYDHLNGLVFLDRIDSTKDIISEEIYFKS